MGRDGDGVTVRDTSIQLAFTYAGKRRRETLKVDGTTMPPTPANIKLARNMSRRIRVALADGTFVYGDWFPHSKHAATTDGVTLKQACETWLMSKGRLALNTRRQYENAAGVWQTLIGADRSLASITHGQLAALVGSHPWRSAKLLNNYLIVLRGVFRLALRDLKMADPTEGLDNAPHQKPPPDPLTAAERDKVLADMARHYDARVQAYFRFAFATGLRPEEQIAMRWGDIDWHAHTARVQRARTAGGHEGAVKTYAVRDIELTKEALAALEAMKAWTFMKGPDADVFQNPVTGKPWHDERSQRDHYWRPSLRRCGVRDRRAYCTRHTFATSALMAGVNIAYIARQLGHSNARMLLTTYAKWIDTADRGRERAKLDAAQEKEFPRNDTERRDARSEKAR